MSCVFLLWRCCADQEITGGCFVLTGGGGGGRVTVAPWGLSLPQWGWRSGTVEMWSLALALTAVAPFPEHPVVPLNVEV